MGQQLRSVFWDVPAEVSPDVVLTVAKMAAFPTMDPGVINYITTLIKINSITCCTFSEMMDKLVCQTTGREISEWDFVSGRLSSNGGCICNEDGLMPVCANTRDRPICPDGTRADRNKNTLPPMFKNCRYN